MPVRSSKPREVRKHHLKEVGSQWQLYTDTERRCGNSGHIANASGRLTRLIWARVRGCGRGLPKASMWDLHHKTTVYRIATWSTRCRPKTRPCPWLHRANDNQHLAELRILASTEAFWRSGEKTFLKYFLEEVRSMIPMRFRRMVVWLLVVLDRYLAWRGDLYLRLFEVYHWRGMCRDNVLLGSIKFYGRLLLIQVVKNNLLCWVMFLHWRESLLQSRFPMLQ